MHMHVFLPSYLVGIALLEEELRHMKVDLPAQK